MIVRRDPDLSDLDVPAAHRLQFPSQAAHVVFLRSMVDLYRDNQLVRQKAHQIVFEWAGCPPRARICHALAIGRWVQENITYVNEGTETFQTPVRTLTYRYGDCDDFSSLICSLLESVGIPSELVALEWQGEFRHIFPRAVLSDSPRATLPLDATLTAPVAERTNPIELLHRRGIEPRALVL